MRVLKFTSLYTLLLGSFIGIAFANAPIAEQNRTLEDEQHKSDLLTASTLNSDDEQVYQKKKGSAAIISERKGVNTSSSIPGLVNLQNPSFSADFSFSEAEAPLLARITFESPTANAGEDKTYTDTDRNGEEEVTLDGTGSVDPDGNIANYRWSIAGEGVASGGTPTIILPLGSTTILLTVTDDNGETDEDEVIITIKAPANEAPVARAGADFTVIDTDRNGMEPVTLNGSGSTDPDNNIRDYSWSIGGEVKATGEIATLSLPVALSSPLMLQL